MADLIDLAAQFAAFIGTETTGPALRIIPVRRIFALLLTTGKGCAFSLLMRRGIARRSTALMIRLSKRNDTAKKQNHTQQSLSHAHNKLYFPEPTDAKYRAWKHCMPRYPAG